MFITDTNVKPVTEMVNNLGWDPLELQRLRARLTMLFKIQQNLVAVPMPSVISVPVRSTPRHPHDFQHMYTSTNSYKYSFFIHTVHQWNLLPPSIASMASLSSFKAAMDSYSPKITLSCFNMHLAFSLLSFFFHY